MNIKSLLLGSAAALVAVSGARAADAVVVAEPEPVEYVRVCDVYGTGFYYMPGTETCLKVSGYIRYDIGVAGPVLVSQSVDKLDLSKIALSTSTTPTTSALVRPCVLTPAPRPSSAPCVAICRSTSSSMPTRVRDLRWIRTRRPSDRYTNEEVAINHAYIELGGFLIGKTNSLFTTFTDYAGTVINDDFVPYGPYRHPHHPVQVRRGQRLHRRVALEEGTGMDDVIVNIDGTPTFVNDGHLHAGQLHAARCCWHRLHRRLGRH